MTAQEAQMNGGITNAVPAPKPEPNLKRMVDDELERQFELAMARSKNILLTTQPK